MNKAKLLLIFLATFIVFSYLGHYTLVSQHEDAHQQVYKKYNIDSEIDINYLTLSGKTTPEIKNIENCGDQCKHEQNLTEIFGYHVMGFASNLWLMFLILMVIKILGAKNE